MPYMADTWILEDWFRPKESVNTKRLVPWFSLSGRANIFFAGSSAAPRKTRRPNRRKQKLTNSFFVSISRSQRSFLLCRIFPLWYISMSLEMKKNSAYYCEGKCCKETKTRSTAYKSKIMPCSRLFASVTTPPFVSNVSRTRLSFFGRGMAIAGSSGNGCSWHQWEDHGLTTLMKVFQIQGICFLVGGFNPFEKY